MRKETYIGIAALTGIGLVTFLRCTSKKESVPVTDENKVSETSEDQYSDQKSTSKSKRPHHRFGIYSRALPKKSALSYKTSLSKTFQSYLDTHFSSTQVVVKNNSSQSQKVSIWGANTRTQNPKEITQTTRDFSVQVGLHPQQVIYNPVNNLFYVVNQLSDSVSVLNPQGLLVTTIELATGMLPSISPVSIAVNTKASSTTFGNVFVVGSISNKVYEIDLNFVVVNTYDAQKRPVAIAFNEVNESIYIANLVSNSLTKIALVNDQTTTLTGYENPRAIEVHRASGNIYIFNSTSQTITVLDRNELLLKQGISVVTDTGKFGYYESEKAVYFSVTDQNNLVKFEDATQEIVSTITTGARPFSIGYNQPTDQLYVTNLSDQNYTVLNRDGSTNILPQNSAVTNFSISTRENTILASSVNEANASFSQRKPAVSFSQDYLETREDFQHNPTKVEHLRIIGGISQQLKNLQLVEKTVTGKEVCTSLSFNKYSSPQNFIGVSELPDVKGAVINGQNSWCFDLAARSRITFLIYHKQIETYDLLPETSRKSTGVEMSHGLPFGLK